MNAQHVGRGLRHGDHIGGHRSFRGIHDRFTGVEHFAGVIAWLPIARQQRALGVQLADQERLFVGFGPAFIVANAEITGQLAQRFGMTGAFLTDVDTHQRHAETLHAAQSVEQFAIGNDAHPAGLKRFITGVQRFPELFVLAQQTFRLRQALAFQARFQPGLRGHQLTAQFFHQETVRLTGTFFTGQRAQFRRRFYHRQLGDQHLNIFQEQIGCFPAAQQQDVTGDFRRHVRVAVAVAAHPGSEANRHKVDRQAIAQIFFQLFVQLAQVVWHPFPQAVFHHRKAPFGFVDRAWAMLTNFIGVPGLSNQLAQAAHKLVTFVVGNVFVIQLLQTVVHFHHFVDQRTTRDFGWVCGQHQLQRKGFHRFFDGRFVEVGLIFEFTKGAGNDFRVAGRFAFWRNAVVLLSGVCQVQKLAEGAGNGQ